MMQPIKMLDVTEIQYTIYIAMEAMAKDGNLYGKTEGMRDGRSEKWYPGVDIPAIIPI